MRSNTDVKQLAARLQAHLDHAVLLVSFERSAEALQTFDAILREAPTGAGAEMDLVIAVTLYNKGAALGASGKREGAVAAWGELLARFGRHSHAGIVRCAMDGAFNRAGYLRKLGRMQEALVAYDEIVARVDASEDAADLETLALALLNKGYVLDELGRDEAAIEVYSRVWNRFARYAELSLKLTELVVNAVSRKADALRRMGRLEASVALSTHNAQWLLTRTEPEFIEPCASAVLSAAEVLACLERVDEALAAYDLFVTRFAARREPRVRQQLGKALHDRAALLAACGRSDEAVAAFAVTVQLIGASDDPHLQACVAQALDAWKEALIRIGRQDEIALVERERERLNRDASAVTEFRHVVDALHTFARQTSPRHGEAIFDGMSGEAAAIQRSGDDSAVLDSLLKKGLALGIDGRLDEAITQWRSALQIVEDRRDHGARVVAAAALAFIGEARLRQGRIQEAVAAFTQVLRSNTGKVHPDIAAYTTMAEHSLAKLERHGAGG